MIRIKKENEPQELTQFKRKYPYAKYSDLDKTDEGKSVRSKIREALVNEQHGLCAYCCCKITSDRDDSLNEHIKPQDKFPNNTLDYDNFVASCVNKKNCGSFKGNEYTDGFISPLETDCEEHFKYYPNGEIVGNDNRGQVTCDILNLNAYNLQKARKAMLRVAKDLGDSNFINDYILSFDSDGMYEQGFIDIVKYYLNHMDIL